MDQLLKIIEKFPRKRIGIIGDLMLDRYLSCEVKRISQEAPVLIAKVLDERVVLGGAANVAANIRSLGGEAEIFGIVGADLNGELMLEMLREHGIESSFSFEASGRPTTIKTRLVSGNQQIIRVDRENDESISEREERAIIKRLPAFLEKHKIVIVSDYAKGLVTENIAREIIRLAQKRGIKVLSDPVPETFSKFKDSYLVKPNKDEAENIAGVKFGADYSNAEEILKVLREEFNSNLAVTLGKDGVLISEGNGFSRVKSLAREVFDVSGAGDTVMAALALSLASGANLRSSALIGNFTAGVVVGKVGTATASADEVSRFIKESGEINYAGA